MFKNLLLLVFVFALLLAPAATNPATAGTAAVGAVVSGSVAAPADLFRRTPRKGRPNYVHYTGGARKKMRKLGPVRRHVLHRRAQAKRRTYGIPSVKAGTPTRVMKK